MSSELMNEEGPWTVDTSRAAGRATRARVLDENGTVIAAIECASANTAEAKDVAGLIAQAPAMNLALALIVAGKAQLHNTLDKTGGVMNSRMLTAIEFGGRFHVIPIDDSAVDWNKLISMIGWDVARAALKSGVA